MPFRPLLFTIILAALSLMTRCIKTKDDPISFPQLPYPTTQVSLGELYQYKQYYSIKTNQLIYTSSNSTWDIAFASFPSKLRPTIQNYGLSRGVNGINTYSFAFDPIINPSYYTTNMSQVKYANYYDPNDTLFGNSYNWTNNTILPYVYVLQINENKGNESPKLVKFQILNHTANSVTFCYANLDNSDKKTITLPIDPNTNYTYYSFTSHQKSNIEPPSKSSWDIEFTRYVQNVTSFGITQYYAVSGALLNPSSNLSVASLDDRNLNSFTPEELNTLTYSPLYYAIGYNWKVYSAASNKGFYTILPRSYIIKSDNQYYGIQFVGFTKVINNNIYNGYPEFMYRKF